MNDQVTDAVGVDAVPVGEPQNPIMYAVAYRYQDDAFYNFADNEADMEFPSFRHLLPSEVMATAYVEEILSNAYVVVPVEITSYNNTVLGVAYEDPAEWAQPETVALSEVDPNAGILDPRD